MDASRCTSGVVLKATQDLPYARGHVQLLPGTQLLSKKPYKKTQDMSKETYKKTQLHVPLFVPTKYSKKSPTHVQLPPGTHNMSKETYVKTYNMSKENYKKT